MQKSLFIALSTALALTGCGQNPQNQHTTNPQYQTQNQANPNIDCTPIANPNYVPGGNQAQYYYPEGCQPPVNNGYANNGYNNGYNGYPNNGSNIGGYVGAAAVGAAAGALANRAYNRRNNTTVPAGNTATNNRIVVPPIQLSNTGNNRTYTPATTRNSSVYRQSGGNRATAVSRSSRRR